MKRLLIFFILLLGFVTPLAAKEDAAFKDVGGGHLNQEAIEYFKSAKVIEGYGDKTFRPQHRINRAEFVKILVAAQVKNPSGQSCFKDVKKEWFSPYVCTAKNKGWIEGYADGTFGPGNYINFAEASKIIAKAMGVKAGEEGDEWFAPYIRGLEDLKAIPSTVQFFDHQITRGEMAEIIWRLKTDKTDKVSSTYTEISSSLPTLQSCEALYEKFQEDQYEPPEVFLQFDEESEESIDMDLDDSKSISDTLAQPADSGATGAAFEYDDASSSYSTTNIQVSGVDEADIVKNDGKFIYLIKGGTVRIVKAYPPKDMDEVEKLEFDDGNFYPTELYLHDNHLIVMGTTWEGFSTGRLKSLLIEEDSYHLYNSTKTKVFVIDITDRSKAKVARMVTFDGNYFKSRLVKNHLYTVMNAYPPYWTQTEETSGEQFLLRFQDGKGQPQVLANCDQIRYFPGHAAPNYLVVASVPLDDMQGEINREVFLGNSDNLYASRTHMYLATTQVNYGRYNDWDWRNDKTNTLVFKFDLADGQIKFEKRGQMPGTILNQFSMDAYKDHFRIATTQWKWDGLSNESVNNVYVLDQDMMKVGKLEDVAPGELIYSTRFIGDRLYMVTFEQIDPFFVIDLKDPANPQVLGALKIPGFSNYLHPYDENHIIGFGQEIIQDEWGFSTSNGMKVGLFDVTNVSKPKQKFAIVIGEGTTTSELLNDHKALLFDREKKLLAFPITIVETVSPGELQCNRYRYSTCPAGCLSQCIPTKCEEGPNGEALCTDDCEGLGSCKGYDYDTQTTTFAGAIVFSLDLEKGFKERGRVTHFVDQDKADNPYGWYWDYQKTIRRILYIGDYLYTVSQDLVKANNLDDAKEVNTLKLEGEDYDYYLPE